MRDNGNRNEVRRVTPDGATPATDASATASWEDVAGRLRSRGMRWTPQRRNLIEVLKEQNGHVTATEIIARCREIDPATTPSTVYRTLDLLEEMGLVRHGHGAGGREDYHILPEQVHGHLYCLGCEGTWEIGPEEGAAIVKALSSIVGFDVDLSHVTISGWCEHCHD
jgi:Fur family ferric uptake transcriptional regulator